MRVFVDASVIIAAMLSPSGGSAKVLSHVRSHSLLCVTSQTVIDEVVDVDKAVKLGVSLDTIERFVAQSGLLVRERITRGEIVPYEVLVDADDAHLLAGAVLTRCSHLVTLDKKHLLRIDIQRKFTELVILAPKELLKQIS